MKATQGTVEEIENVKKSMYYFVNFYGQVLIQTFSR